MNDLNRASLDAEIERIHEKMAQTDQTSDEYSKLVKNAEVLMRVANDDDKIQCEAKAEELKIESENERIKDDSKWKKIGNYVAVATAAITSIGSIACCTILCIVNLKAQKRSIDFEERGFAHTDRSDKFMFRSTPKF